MSTIYARRNNSDSVRKLNSGLRSYKYTTVHYTSTLVPVYWYISMHLHRAVERIRVREKNAPLPQVALRTKTREQVSGHEQMDEILFDEVRTQYSNW